MAGQVSFSGRQSPIIRIVKCDKRIQLMRCPKCGYISFDYLDECLKCKKNIKAATSKLQGTVFNVAAPLFLKVQSEEYQVPEDPVDLFADEPLSETDQYLDEDLEILVDPDEDGFADEDREFADEDDGPGPDDEESDEEDREIEIDLSQFEDAAGPGGAVGEAEPESDMDSRLKLDMPEELADISDLAPPARKVEPEKAEVKPEPKVDREEPELSLDDLDFDLDVDGITGTMSSLDSEKPLSLDEIDFADTIPGPESPKGRKDGKLSMDDDLDFELDLGGLSIHKDD
jgi:hypothetical protein